MLLNDYEKKFLQEANKWNDIIRDRLYAITDQVLDVKKYDRLRRVFIESAQQQLEHELEQEQRYQNELETLLQTPTNSEPGKRILYETLM
jgi:hypothetical protein